MKNKYETIVIDAANILHNDTGIIMKNDNGEKTSSNQARKAQRLYIVL